MTRTWTRTWTLYAALTLAACSGGGSEEHAADAVALVTLARAERGTIPREVTLYGAAEAGPGGRLTLVAPAEGLVIAIDAPPGTRVGRGQVVARLAPSPTTRVELARASGDAVVASQALARARRLRADGLGSDADVETARATARNAELSRASMAARAAGLTVRATGDGVIESVTTTPGDLVQAGAPVAAISRPSDVRARFGADPALAPMLRAGTPLRIAGAAGRSPLTVPIESVAPVIDPQTRQVAVFARLPGGSGIGAGATLIATATGGGDDTITVPYAALLDDAGTPYLFVVTGGTAHRREVAIGATAGGRVAITDGIRPGEQVVVEGGTAIEDGVKVRTR